MPYKRILKLFLISIILLQPIKILSQVHVTLPDTTAKKNTFIFIPVTVSDLTNKGIKLYNFSVTFNRVILKCEGIKTYGTLSNTFTWRIGTDIGKNKVSIKANGLVALKGSGTLIYLKFKVVGNSGSTNLNFRSVYFNYGIPSAIKHNGKFTVYVEKRLKIKKVGNGAGYITVNDVEYELPFDKLLAQGSVYKLQALNDTSSEFVRWSGDIISTKNPFNLTLKTDTKLEVRFRLKRFEIITKVSPENSGFTEGSGKYNYGETATIKATSNDDWYFINWTENSNEVFTDSTYSFVVTKKRTLTANFSNENYTISADVEPVNSGTVIGTGNYHAGEVIELIAEPYDGWNFVEWVNDDGTVFNEQSFVITVTGDQHYTAKFGNILFSVVTISDPIEGGSTSGGGFYYFGQTAELSATANEGWKFLNWTDNGDLISEKNEIEVNVNCNLNYQANFERKLYTVTTFSSPIDGGSTTGGGFYFYNQNAQITAIANDGWKFTEWTENDTMVSMDSNFSININNHRNLIANFNLLTDLEDGHNKPILSFINKPFPNPFNPSTVFRFGIANESEVSLSIFDVNGKLVSDLINSELFRPGIYNRIFNTSNLNQVSSGVYFYRFKSIESNSDNILYESGKLLLIK